MFLKTQEINFRKPWMNITAVVENFDAYSPKPILEEQNFLIESKFPQIVDLETYIEVLTNFPKNFSDENQERFWAQSEIFAQKRWNFRETVFRQNILMET